MSKADGAFLALTKRWSFATAQTNAKLVDVGATQKVVVLFAKAKAGNSNTVDVAVEIGIAAATLPAVTDDSLTGGTGVFLSDSSLARGAGEVNANSGLPIAVGEVGEDVYLTCTAATGGALRIILQYRLLEDQ